MGKLIKPIFWAALFLVMMLAIDQFFVQIPAVHPAHKAVTDFYLDFRSRLIDLTFGEKKMPKSIEAVIEKQQNEEKPAPTKKQKGTPSSGSPQPKADTKDTQRYIYSDGEGELHFADSLDDVPESYRKKAQPMSR